MVNAPIAQRTRALRFGRRGREFKSLWGRQILISKILWGYSSVVEQLALNQFVEGSNPSAPTRNMKKITKIIIALVLVLLLVGMIAFRKLKSDGLSVKAINIENLVVRKTVTASGVVKSENFVNLSFPVLAKIQKINYKKGDFVKKGEVIAVAYNYSAYQDSQAAKDNRDVTKRDLDQFVQQYGRNKFKYGGVEE